MNSMCWFFLWDIRKDSLFVSGMRCEQWRAEISVKDCAFFSDLLGHFHWSSWSHSSFPQAAHMFKWLCARFIFHPPNANVKEFLFLFLASWHIFSLFVWFSKAHTFADCFSAGDLSSVCLKTIINSEDWRRATRAASTEGRPFGHWTPPSTGDHVAGADLLLNQVSCVKNPFKSLWLFDFTRGVHIM